MNKSFYNGPEIEIGETCIKIKKRNIKISYRDDGSIRIVDARLHRAWLLYILAGIAAMSLILLLFIMVIRGVFGDSAGWPNGGVFFRRRTIIPFMFIFIGGPVFIYMKIRKYFRKYPMLVIRWDHHDFRIRVSDLHVDAGDLKTFLETKTGSGPVR